MVHLLEEERKEKRKKKKKERRGTLEKETRLEFLASTERSPVPGRWWSAKVIYLVSHSGRTLLPQTQGRRHVSQHLIHVRVRHAAPGSTENKNGDGTENQRKGGRREGRKQKKKQNQKQNHRSRKNVERCRER